MKRHRMADPAPGPRRKGSWPCPSHACAVAALGLLCVPAPGRAQDGIAVTPAFRTDEYIASDVPLEFRVSGASAGSLRELAVFIGSTDVSALIEWEGDTFRYSPTVIRLPAGEHEVSVYRVADGATWTEVGRIPIRVLTQRGFERISYDPRLAIENTGQVAEDHSIDPLAPERETYQDFTFRFGFETQHVRPGMTVRSQANTVGSSNRRQALRFGTEQDDAPRYDLADYIVRAETGRTALSVGHVSAGANRFLMNTFASRGLALETAAGPVSAKLAAVNGTSVVGWSNPVGLGENGHRILSADIGVDALAGRAGTLRVDATLVDGSVRPFTGYGQQAITDAEASRGVGVQISASDASGRIRFNGAYARSSFDDVENQLLSRGNTLVLIRDETRNARHLDFSVDVLRSLRIGQSTFASLSTAVRHERVDPQYRSVAAYTQSDVQENAFDINASVGPVTARIGISRRNDNLDGIPSILTTRTQSGQASVALPLGLLIGATTSTWLPQLSYNLNRVHQFGEDVPQNGGFSESHVPDQLSSVHGLTAQWFRSVWQLMYRFDRSTQDNRQEGRENADFERTNHAVTVGVNPRPALTVSLDGSIEEDLSSATDQRNRTRRIAVTTNLRVWQRTGVGLFGSQAWTTDPLDDGPDRVVRQVRIELSQGLTLFTRPSGSTTGQFFVRFAHQRGDLFGLSTGGATPSAWTLNTGFNLSLF